MSLEHIKIYTGDTITVRRLKHILEDNGIHSIVKEDTIVGYEISNGLTELLVLNSDEATAKNILAEFKI